MISAVAQTFLVAIGILIVIGAVLRAGDHGQMKVVDARMEVVSAVIGIVLILIAVAVI